MSIIRGPRPNSNFYILDKRISEDRRLSWAGRGLLVYLLGKPDHWQVSVQALVNETKSSPKPTGRDATWSLLRELIEAGYCTRNQSRKSDGTLGEMDYTISEDCGHCPLTDEPRTAYPCTDEPGTANPTQVSIEKKQGLIKKQELSNTSADAPVTVKGSFIAKPEEVTQTTWDDFLALRKEKRAKLTGTALAGIKREADAAGWTLENALSECCTRGWQGFKAEWVADKAAAAAETVYQRSMRERMAEVSPLLARPAPGAKPAENVTTFFQQIGRTK